MTRLSVCLLGPPRVTIDDKPVTSFESDKVRALLAYLAVESGQPQRRETLAGLLWPGWPERSARANLRRALTNLRSTIGDRARSENRAATPPFLYVSRQTIQFNGSGDTWVDVTAFTRLVETSAKCSPGQAIERLEKAVALYQGRFLKGFSLADSPAFEEWILLNRERLHRQATDALGRLAEYYEQCGDYEIALRHAWRRVELDPWREKAHRQVMRLLAHSGQRGAALAQYETCCRLLATQLNVEPAAETTQLYETIRRGKLQAPVSHPKSAPIQPNGSLKEHTTDVAAAPPPEPKPLTWRRALSRLWAGKNLRWVGAGLLLLVVAGIVISRFIGSRTTEPFVVKVWPHGMDNQEVLLAQAEMFNNNHPNVQVDIGPWESSLFDLAGLEQPPCVIELWHPGFHHRAWSGLLIPLDEYVSDELRADLSTSAIAQGSYDDRLYGLGAGELPYGLIWGETDTLERAGVRIPVGVEDAWDKDEFVDALARLQALDEVETAIQFDLDMPWTYSQAFAPIMLSFGCELPGPYECSTFEGTLNGPEAVEALVFIKDLFDHGYAGMQASIDESDLWTEPVGLWWTNDRDLMKRRAYLGDKMAFIPPPKFGERAVTMWAALLWGIPAACPNPDAAWEFLEFLTSPEQVRLSAEANLWTPARRSALAQSELYGEGGPLNLSTQLVDSGAVVSWPVTPVSERTEPVLGTALRRIIIEGADVQTALDRAVEEIDWHIEANKCYRSP